MLVSATRLHLRSLRYLVPFILQVRRIQAQLRRSPGCLGVELRKTRGLAFWTKVVWQSREALLAFNNAGAHQAGKSRLSVWCDEAVHTHWDHVGEKPPVWAEAEAALRRQGRLNQLDHPSSAHRAGQIVLD